MKTAFALRARLGMLLAIAALVVAPFFAPAARAADPAPLSKVTISVNGAERTYSYFVSSKANSFNGQWVVFALHDNGQSAEQFAAQSGWVDVAEQNGFAVVFPQAVNNKWTPASGAEDDYLKAVFEHARTNLISRYPGDNAPAIGGNASGSGGKNNPIWAWEPLRDLTGSGAGGTVAEEFAMNHPGLFAAVATLNGTAYKAAYAEGDQPAQNVFEHMRGKTVERVWKQKKKDVPETVWMFSNGPATPAQLRQAAYWKQSSAVGPAPVKRSIGGFATEVYQNPTNPAEQVRLTQLDAAAQYDKAMSSAIWGDLFAHLARWTSSPNGDLTTVLTEAEVNKQFEVHTLDTGDSKPYAYYLKLPSSYRKGQKLPLVLSAHGANEQAWLFLSKIKLHEVGEAEGFITVYPNGHQNRWASDQPDGPDAKFLEMLVKEVVANYGADPTRVYMQGFSNGSAMTTMMAVTHPLWFAAASPANGAGPVQGMVKQRVEELKARSDVRIPVLAVYGAVDSGSSVDGKILANGTGAQGGIEMLEKYDNIATKDRIEKVDSPYTEPYDAVALQGKLVPQAIDKRYPAGRFQVYHYSSADPRPMGLLEVAWIVDTPHAYDLREARMQWDFFKHWQRNADGSLTWLN